MHTNPVIYYQSKMQLRSGKTTASKQIKICVEVQDKGEMHYKSVQSIFGLLFKNFTKMDTLEYTSLERIRIIRKIFILVESKMDDFHYLIQLPLYENIKKLYLIITDKIPRLIRSISEIMNDRVNLDDSEIEDISSCLNLLMKLRKQFK